MRSPGRRLHRLGFAAKEECVLQSKIEQEIRELHQFFEDWFAGRLPRSDDGFARFSRAMDAGFHIVTPSGVLMDLPTLTEGLEAMHGTRDRFRIEIRNVRLRKELAGTWLVTYEEWQETAEGMKGRISTAWLRARDDAPLGLEWLHVHEAWLDGSHGV